MANFIDVDYIEVIAAADRMKNINTNMTNSFKDNIEKNIKTLDANWEGKAASKILDHYFKIKAQLVPAREAELANLENILRVAVGKGYSDTENANKNLASLFK